MATNQRRDGPTWKREFAKAFGFTLCRKRMAALDFDVLIIGAGPAGSTAAAFARQRGLAVLVVEKDAFPRFHIGESLLPNGNALLKASGAWPKVEQAGFFKKYGASFFLSDGDAEKEVIFSQGMVPGLDYTYQVERARFDALLLEHAQSLGAHVLHETTVRAVEMGAEICRTTLETKDGEHAVSTRWILDGSGRENLFASELKRRLDPPRLARRVAVYSHFEGVRRASGTAAGHTVVVRLPDGWFWLIPLDDRITSVGLVTSASKFRQNGGAPADIFHQTVTESPRLRQLMGDAQATQPFRVTTDYSYFRRDLASERMLLIGDAAGFFDPIFSSGVYVALYSAKRAVESIAAAQAQKRPLTCRECTAYTRHLKSHARVFERLINVFYDNDSFAIFMSPRPPLKMGHALNAIVAGHARLTWPLRWRYHLFLLICRLQRRMRLSQPIAFPPVAPLGSQHSSVAPSRN